MATAIRAIETKWRGRHFRSRLEARWAVAFDTLGIKYQYEPEGFRLRDGSGYLPDFYLPEVKWYAEVKPHVGECGKAHPFVESTGLSALRLDGEPGFRSYTGLTRWESDSPDPVQHYTAGGCVIEPFVSGWQPGEVTYQEFSLDVWTYRQQFTDEGRLWSDPDYASLYMNVSNVEDLFSIRYRAAVEAALSARFDR